MADPGKAEQASLQHVFSHNPPGAEHSGGTQRARLHRYRYLDGTQALAAQDQQHADILIVEQAGLARGEYGHRRMVIGSEARGDVFQFQAGQPAEIAPGDPPGTAGTLWKGADGDFSLAVDQRLQQGTDVLGFVLAVGVEGDGGAIALAQGIAQTGLNRAPGPELQDQRQHSGAGASGGLGCGVAAAIVDDHHRTVPQFPDLGDDGPDGGFLIVGGDQGDGAVGFSH